MRKYFLVLLSCIYIFIGCRKESVLTNDAGAVFSYTPVKVDNGISIGEIYSSKYFAAFTDVAYYNGSWYTAFRVGTNHVGGENGQIEVISSVDGNVWKVMKVFTIKNLDLREAKFTIDSTDNIMYLNFWARNQKKNGKVDVANYLVKFNQIQNVWGAVQQIKYNHDNSDQFVFWHPTYHKKNMYCVAYRIPVLKESNDNIQLFVNNRDFVNFRSLGRIIMKGRTSETTLRFNEADSMYMLVRTEDVVSPLGISLPPDYGKETWIQNPLLTVLASPNFLIYKNKLLITGRDSEKRSFRFYAYDLKSKVIQKIYTFPSGYETGYGGMSFNPENKDELWITYYSIKNSGSSINLAKINLLKFLK